MGDASGSLKRSSRFSAAIGTKVQGRLLRRSYHEATHHADDQLSGGSVAHGDRRRVTGDQVRPTDGARSCSADDRCASCPSVLRRRCGWARTAATGSMFLVGNVLIAIAALSTTRWMNLRRILHEEFMITQRAVRLALLTQQFAHGDSAHPWGRDGRCDQGPGEEGPLRGG